MFPDGRATSRTRGCFQMGGLPLNTWMFPDGKVTSRTHEFFQMGGLPLEHVDVSRRLPLKHINVSRREDYL